MAPARACRRRRPPSSSRRAAPAQHQGAGRDSRAGERVRTRRLPPRRRRPRRPTAPPRAARSRRRGRGGHRERASRRWRGRRRARSSTAVHGGEARRGSSTRRPPAVRRAGSIQAPSTPSAARSTSRCVGAPDHGLGPVAQVDGGDGSGRSRRGRRRGRRRSRQASAIASPPMPQPRSATRVDARVARSAGRGGPRPQPGRLLQPVGVKSIPAANGPNFAARLRAQPRLGHRGGDERRVGPLGAQPLPEREAPSASYGGRASSSAQPSGSSRGAMLPRPRPMLQRRRSGRRPAAGPGTSPERAGTRVDRVLIAPLVSVLALSS